jgi:hypothetical protein
VPDTVLALIIAGSRFALNKITIMKALLLLSIAFGMAAAAQGQQLETKTIYRYGEEIRISADTAAVPKKLTARIETGKVFLNWIVYNCTVPGMYIIERSIEGKDFQVIGFKQGIPTSIPLDLAFYYTDDQPINGKAVYRVTHISHDNKWFGFPEVTVKKVKAAADSSEEITAKAF